MHMCMHTCFYRVGEVEEVARVDHRRVGVVDERECAVLAQQHVLEMPISRGEEEVEERRAHHGAPVDPPQLVDHRACARAVRILLVGPLRARAQQHVGRDALRQLGHHRRPPRRRRLLGRAVGVRLNHAELRHPLASDEAVEQAAVGTDGVDEARVLALVLEHLAFTMCTPCANRAHTMRTPRLAVHMPCTCHAHARPLHVPCVHFAHPRAPRRCAA